MPTVPQPHPSPADLTLEEYKALRTLQRAVDDLLEESLRERENLTQSFRRCFPPVLKLAGARAMAITTRDEEFQGVKVPAGSYLHIRFAAGNVDPAQYDCPFRLDLSRKALGNHLSFSLGPRTCPGAGISRRRPPLRCTPPPAAAAGSRSRRGTSAYCPPCAPASTGT